MRAQASGRARRSVASPLAGPAGRRRLLLFGLVLAAGAVASWWLSPPPARDLSSDMTMVLDARARIVRHHLVADNADCLAFLIRPDMPDGITPLDVLQKHNAHCPGDPDTASRLFGLRVHRPDGRMWEDAGHPGRFVPLGP